MSRVPNRSARAATRTAAASPAVAGFRPKLAVAAVAAAFSLQPQLLQAQPSGAHAIHGKASVTSDGRNVTVRTTNGKGTSHSAIDWQSFSVPGGSTTRFIQPSAASTSINRVLGGDPSAIYGTLSSNGKLVLVNPAGIAVGAGGVVDTAGFTASTLPMRDADAIAGRLVFQGTGGPLTVDGHVLARGGDVVLLGSSVQVGSGAVVQSDGATLVAAGERVALTGRGLEGIQLEVNAGNEVLNLGTLKGDAVGIFAGTLRHSGHIAADAVTSRGGKVVLQARGGDAYVRGSVSAKAGRRGGSIDVLGERVALEAGALLRASGRDGGGQVRVGGDYQGANANVPNAKRVYMDANARIEADATRQGDGGRVIVWSDEVTRMHGNISARGGQSGGDGGFVEVSGKEHLQYTGLVDLRAAQGRRGTLLLDPEDIVIAHEPTPTFTPEPPYGSDNTSSATTESGEVMFAPISADTATLTDRHLNDQLQFADVLVKTTATADDSGNGGTITVNEDAVVSWSSGHSLRLEADKGINMLGTIDGNGAVVFTAKNGDIDVQAGSTLRGSSVRLETLAAGTDINVHTQVEAISGGIHLDAKDAITGDGIFTTQGGAAGSVHLQARGGDVAFSRIDADGAPGQRGGDVNVFATADVSFENIRADGGWGDLALGGEGGRGGSVHVKYGGELRTPSSTAPPIISANGGDGATVEGGGGGGRGGDGGVVVVEGASGDLVIDDLDISVLGGNGGYVASTDAGAGGDGGRVIFKAAGKTIINGDVVVRASGGLGRHEPAFDTYAADGAMGSLETRSGVTEVSGYLGIHAKWENTRVMNVTGGHVFGDTGRNAGEIHLSGDTIFEFYELENSGLFKVHSGGAQAWLSRNTGTIEVAKGATLSTSYFTSNEGVLNVNGTLRAYAYGCDCSEEPPLEELALLALDSSSSSFVNQAGGVISGTGTLMINDGQGWLENHGKIAPGGVGTTGKLTIDGNLQMHSDSVLHADIVNTLTHDILAVTGTTITGGKVEVGHPAGTSIKTGDTFAVLQAGMLEPSAMPGVSSGAMTVSASGYNLVLRATAPVPAPTPAPSVPQQQAQQEVLGEIITFQQLFEQQQRDDDQGEPGRDDIVVTDTSCLPR